MIPDEDVLMVIYAANRLLLLSSTRLDRIGSYIYKVVTSAIYSSLIYDLAD